MDVDLKGSCKGKRLLILGANTETVPLIERANELGVITYVADPDPYSPGKRHAAYPVNIDAMDVAALAHACREEKIDGVTVGVADQLVEPCAKLCEAMGYPAPASVETCQILSNKLEFNHLLQQFGLNPIPYKVVRSKESIPVLEFSYPIIVKPVDSNSGKGLTKCYAAKCLPGAIDDALENSKSGTVLIEKFMQSPDSFVYTAIINGKVCTSASADRFTTQIGHNKGQVCIGAKYPLSCINIFERKYKDKLERLLASLNINTGVLMLSAFIVNKQMYFYDPGFRLQGEAPDIQVEEVAGVSHRSLLIEYALKGEAINKQQYWQSHVICHEGGMAVTLWLLCKPGAIASIRGISQLDGLSGVHHVRQRLKVGSIVTESMQGTESQVLSRIYLKGNDQRELRNTVEKILSLISVCDANGSELLNKKGYENLWQE